MRVVFAGTPEVAVPALEAVAASRHELVGVVTRPDAPSGRGRRLVASPVAQRAEELGVPVLKPEHPRDPDFQAALADLRPDACPVVAYGALLPRGIANLLAAGRHISTDAVSHTFMREIPQCWVTGQAAGTAAALSVRQGAAPGDLDIGRLQQSLIDQNVPLGA